MNWDLIYSLKIGVAVLGAFLSLPLVEHNRKRKPIRAVAESLMSVLAAVAIVEKFLLHHSVLWCALWGGVIGVAVGYSWDAIRAIAPNVSLFMVRLTIKRAVAKAIGVDLPDTAFEKPTPNRQPETLNQAEPHALSEENDLNAIEFLDEVPKLPPPRGVRHGQFKNVKGRQESE